MTLDVGAHGSFAVFLRDAATVRRGGAKENASESRSEAETLKAESNISGIRWLWKRSKRIQTAFVSQALAGISLINFFTEALRAPMPPPQKRRKTAHVQKAGTSVSSLKKKVRDIERLLSRPNSTLLADARVENERALEAFKHELSIAMQSRTEQKMAKKYHMVRFFERQKATRRLNKVMRGLKLHNEERSVPEDLRQKIRDAEVELNYTLHYPRGEKYISLFKDPGTGTDAIEKRNAIKRDIELRMEKGALGARTMEDVDEDHEQEDDEGRQATKAAKAKTRKEQKGKKGGKKTVRNEEPGKVGGGGIEDDDFFEF